MDTFTAEHILSRLNERTEIDYCALNQAEVVQIIINAYKEQKESQYHLKK